VFGPEAGRVLGLVALVALIWTCPQSTRAETVVLRLDGLTSAPFAPVEGAPQVIVQRPSEPSERVDVVLYLHGYEGCIEVLASREPRPCRAGMLPLAGWDLLGAHRESETTTWFVLVQLAFMERSGRPGTFMREGQAARFIEEVLARVAQERREARSTLRSLTLAAHSAAFETTIAVLRYGGLGARLTGVLLLDAMYSGGPVFLRWARDGATNTLVALATPGGTTAARAQALRPSAERARSRVIFGDGRRIADITPGSIALLTVRGPHRDVPRPYLPELLRRLFPR